MLRPEQEETVGMIPLRLGHEEFSATMIYNHVLNRGQGGVRSPSDRMFLCRSRLSGA